MEIKQSSDGKWYLVSGNSISQDFETREDAEWAMEHDERLCEEQGLCFEAVPDGTLIEWDE